MSLRAPSRILGETLLKKLADTEGQWTVEGDSIRPSAHNTALVMRCLSEAAMESGFIALGILLTQCEVEPLLKA